MADQKLDKIELAKNQHWKFNPRYGHEMINDQSFRVPNLLHFVTEVEDVEHDGLYGLV